MSHAVMILVLLINGCSEPTQDSLASRLRRALGVAPNDSISVDTVTSLTWPKAVFYRARRVPPLSHGEDPRPGVVSAIVRGGDTVLSYSWDHLSQVWSLVGQSHTRNPDSTRASLLHLLDLSSIAPSTRVLRTPSDARGTIVGSVPSIIRQVRAPTVRRMGLATVVTMYTRETGGIFLIDVLISDAGTIEYKRSKIANSVLTH